MWPSAYRKRQPANGAWPFMHPPRPTETASARRWQRPPEPQRPGRSASSKSKPPIGFAKALPCSSRSGLGVSSFTARTTAPRQGQIASALKSRRHSPSAPAITAPRAAVSSRSIDCASSQANSGNLQLIRPLRGEGGEEGQPAGFQQPVPLTPTPILAKLGSTLTLSGGGIRKGTLRIVCAFSTSAPAQASLLSPPRGRCVGACSRPTTTRPPCASRATTPDAIGPAC
jgi:hypothetical protein